MVKILYCSRCQMEIPMLEKHEATYVLKGGHDKDGILRRYFELTGLDETNADQGGSAIMADSDPNILKILELNDPNHLLRGWLLHAHKGRDRHDLAARQCDQQRYWLGIPATIISAIVGTATFAALQASSGPLIQLIVGALAVLAAILTSLQSFLDLGARAERHRLAGAK
jgi:hypothetical protein